MSGDIVKGIIPGEDEEEFKGLIVYDNFSTTYIIISKDNDEWDLGYLDDNEVIGNIYENSNLLEE